MAGVASPGGCMGGRSGRGYGGRGRSASDLTARASGGAGISGQRPRSVARGEACLAGDIRGVQMGGLPRLHGRHGHGGATTAPRWPPEVPWEASSPTRSTLVRAGYRSDYGRRQFCLDGSGGWAWIRGKLQAGVAAAPKSTPSAPITFLEASVWITRPPPLP
ncbi:hypothetical protein VPH35_052101 [Triticum aestivum]